MPARPRRRRDRGQPCRPAIDSRSRACSATTTVARCTSSRAGDSIPRRHASFERAGSSGPASTSPAPGGRSLASVAEYVAPLNDIRFALENLVDLAALSKLAPFAHADPETVYGLLDEFGRFVADVLAPLDRGGDTNGATFDPSTGSVSTAPGWVHAYKRYVESGWGSVPFEPEHGGGGFPWLVAIAMQEILTAGNMAWSLCPLLTQSAIDMLVHHGSEEQQERYLRPMVSGEWTGTMNLTEPQAGSDVGALRTRAVPSRRGRRLVANLRPEDLHHLRRARHDREHRAPRSRSSARRATGHEGHLVLHRPEATPRTRTARSANAIAFAASESNTRWASTRRRRARSSTTTLSAISSASRTPACASCSR